MCNLCPCAEPAGCAERRRADRHSSNASSAAPAIPQRVPPRTAEAPSAIRMTKAEDRVERFPINWSARSPGVRNAAPSSALPAAAAQVSLFPPNPWTSQPSEKPISAAGAASSNKLIGAPGDCSATINQSASATPAAAPDWTLFGDHIQSSAIQVTCSVAASLSEDSGIQDAHPSGESANCRRGTPTGDVIRFTLKVGVDNVHFLLSCARSWLWTGS